MERFPIIDFVNRERYRNPPAPPGYQNQNLPYIVRRESDAEEIQINFQEWNNLGIFDDEDVSIYDNFVINSDSEDDNVLPIEHIVPIEVPIESIVKNEELNSVSGDEEIVTLHLDYIKKEKEEIETENKSKAVENTEQRIDFNKEKKVKITDQITEKKPLAKDDDVEKKGVSEKKARLRNEATKAKSTEQRTYKKPQTEDVIEKRADECKEKASLGHRRKKRKIEDEDNKLKKIKQKIESCKSSHKRSRLLTRDEDSEVKEEKMSKRKVKKYHSPSPTDDCEEDYKKDNDNTKMECDDCMFPDTSIKHESPSIHGMFYCDICNITSNSHITYQSHIIGKRHKKNLNAQNVSQVVAKSCIPTKLTSKCPNNDGTYDHTNIPSTSYTQDHSFKMPSTSSGDQPSTSTPAGDFSELFKLYSHPDPSKAGFYCTICNSHSNSSSMWESHINGKRHIANLKKAPGTAPSKCRNVLAPSGTVARLESQLKDVYEPIVGLDQIREIQRLDINSVSYTCFLCGGISVCEDEIVDHIVLTKHREKYLEKINNPEFETARKCQLSVRCSVIAELCERVEAERGRGRPEVYFAKNSLA